MNHDWEKKRLDNVCSIKSGYTPSFDDLSSNGEFPYFKVAEMNLPGNEKYLINTPSYLSGNIKTFPANSIVFPKNGAAVSTNKKRILQVDSVVDLNTAVMIANQSVSVNYLYYILISIDFVNLVKRGAVPTLNISELKNTVVSVPPMHVQEQIVSELDKINELIAVKRSQLKDLDALAQSLFNETFSSIGETVPLSFYVNALVGGKSLASKEVSPNKVLKSGAVTYDYFDKNSTKYLPVDYTPDAEHSVSTGDLIISRMNTAELVGACAYVFDVDDNVYLPDRLWRIEYKSNANPIYLWKSLISESAKWQIRSKASGTSGSMKNISKPLLLSINIKKVPISIQQQFAERIEAIEAQKKRVEASIADLETLLASRMDYWFND